MNPTPNNATPEQHKTARTPAVGFLLPFIGVALLLIGFGWAIARAAFDNVALILCGLGLLLFLSLFIKTERANIKFYLHVILYSLLVGGICVVLYLFSMQYAGRVDLTKQNINSLSEATTQYLNALEREVQVVIFTPQVGPFQALANLYEAQSDQVQFEFHDAIKEPLFAQQFEERVNNGDIFVVAGENRKRLSVAELPQDFIFQPTVAENTITNAIIDVTRAEKTRIYFTTGHGEVSFYSTPRAARNQQQPPQPSLAALRQALEQRAIETAQLDLASRGDVPDDASIVVIAGPKSDLFPAEREALDEYLRQRNGKLLVLMDPPDPVFPVEMPELMGLLNGWGVELPGEVILDMLGTMAGLDPIYPLFATFDPAHPITSQLSGYGRTFVTSLVRPVKQGTIPPEMTATVLLKSSPQSWSQDLEAIRGQEQINPPPQEQWSAQPYGLALEKQPPPRMPGMKMPPQGGAGFTRLVVYGSSSLITDDYLSVNELAVRLIFNTIDWLAEREEMIAIPPRQLEGTPIMLDAGQMRVIFAVAVVLIPALLFFGGVSYSVMRRRG